MARKAASLLLKGLLGLCIYGPASWGALWLAIWTTLRIGAIVRMHDGLLYAIGVALAGAFAGGLAELVGTVGGVQPPWRRRWTVGIAVVMWLFAAWIALNLSLHPPES